MSVLRMRRRCCLGVALALLAVLVAGPSPAETPAGEPACTLQAAGTHAVVHVIDAETVLLDDASEVRLIGALAPRAPDVRHGAPDWPPEAAAIEALRALVLGGSVELAYAGRRSDRYGRLLAHLFVDRDGERVWVQGELLKGGYARAYGLPGSFACMREMLAHERVARAAGAGLWSNGAYRTRSAQRSGALMRYRNTYQVVEGRLAHVAPTKARTYLNFGADWRRDFTAGIDAGVLRANPMGQDAGGARGTPRRGPRVDRVPQRPLHTCRGSEPDRYRRGRRPVQAARRSDHEQRRGPRPARRSKTKAPGTIWAGRSRSVIGVGRLRRPWSRRRRLGPQPRPPIGVRARSSTARR